MTVSVISSDLTLLEWHVLFTTIPFKPWLMIKDFFHNKPEAEAQRSYTLAALNYKTEREHARNAFGQFFPRVLVNEKSLKS